MSPPMPPPAMSARILSLRFLSMSPPFVAKVARPIVGEAGMRTPPWMTTAATTDAEALRHEVAELSRRLIACDTSDPPGNETQAVAVLVDYFAGSAVRCERVAAEPDRANLIARLPGTGEGPSLAFLVISTWSSRDGRTGRSIPSRASSVTVPSGGAAPST